MVFSNQQKYYDAITESTNRVDCYPFIDFMLNEILDTLKKHQEVEMENKVPNKTLKQYPEITKTTWEVLS